MYNLDKTACSKLGPCVQPSLSFAPDGCAVQWPVINLPMQDQRRFIVKVTSTEWLQSFLFTTWKILSPNDYENVQRCMPCPQINSFLFKTVSSPLSWQQWRHARFWKQHRPLFLFCFSLSLSLSLLHSACLLSQVSVGTKDPWSGFLAWSALLSPSKLGFQQSADRPGNAVFCWSHC